MARHEGGAKASGEGRLRLRHAPFGSGHTGGIAAEEMIHGLFRRQLRNRRQYAKGISRQHDDILRLTAHPRCFDIGNEINRVRGTGVFRQRSIIQIAFTGQGIEHDIFQNRAESLRSGENFRFCLLAEIDHLGIATAFKVEDAIVGPAMFIIADQCA